MTRRAKAGKGKQKTFMRQPLEIIRIQRRVLRLIDKYLAVEDQDSLRGADGGLMTYRELRQHIDVALNHLRVNPRPMGKHRMFCRCSTCLKRTRESGQRFRERSKG